MNALRASILMAGLFLAGLIAPRGIGYPPVGGGSSSSLAWASVRVGAVGLATGSAGLVVMTAAQPAAGRGEDDRP